VLLPAQEMGITATKAAYKKRGGGGGGGVDLNNERLPGQPAEQTEMRARILP
jgi:hypothetical protein